MDKKFGIGRSKVMRRNNAVDPLVHASIDDPMVRAEESAGISLEMFRNFLSLNEPNQTFNFKIPSAAAEQQYKQFEDAEVTSNDNESNKSKIDTDYADDAKQKEKQRFLNLKLNAPPNNESSDLLTYENVSTVNVQPLTSDETEDLYAHNVTYARPKLPIVAHEQNIVEAIKTNRVVIIEGATGCGKTTQVPQFICDDSVRNNVPFNIIITQPRRIAAISIARRVAAERGWTLGQHVGYQIGMDRTCVGQNTRILYCTTGVLLQKLIKEKRIDMYSHIIIDEVHERTEETDILLMIIKRFMASTGFAVKIILMSATFNVTRLQQYYSIPVSDDDVILPSIVAIPEKPADIHVYYLEQLDSLCRETNNFAKMVMPEVNDLSRETPYISTEMYEICARLILYLEQVEANRGGRSRGSVLVFLPGYQEIQDMRTRLYAHNPNQHQWKILPLHSSITIEEQNAVFIAPKTNERKIILATNIAESSVTVPDVEYVIDFCLTKALICDPETHFPVLQLEWASRANCEQRAGRTGRVRDGRCYRLISSSFYYGSLVDYGRPEIMRSPLELSVLRVKLLAAFGSPKELLGLTMDPPNLGDIHTAVLTLKQVGALTVTMIDNNGETFYDDEDGDLTTIGYIMSKLPIDVRLSKLIIMGHVFDVLNDCIIIAACLSTKGMFRRPFTAEMKAYISRMAWSDRTFSDSIAYLNAYKTYERIRESGHFNSRTVSLEEWCKQHYIQHKRIKEIDALIVELTSRLKYEAIEVVDRPNLKRTNEELILKVAMCAAFYPNYFIRGEIDRENVSKMLPQKDPYNSVRIDGLPQNAGIVYAGKLREIFSQCSQSFNLDFEDTKAYITFSDDDRDPLIEQQQRQQQSITGDIIALRETVIKTAVYLAVAMRRWTRQSDGHDWNVLYMLQSELLRDKLEKISDKKKAFKKGGLLSSRISVPMVIARVKIPLLPPPAMDVFEMKIRVTHVQDAAHFWAQHATNETDNILKELSNAIINAQKSDRCDHNTIQLADVVLGQRNNNGKKEYARAKITRIEYCTGTKQVSRVTVFFIDTGDSMELNRVDELLEINEVSESKLTTIPAQAFECKLFGVKPSSVRYFDNTWDKEANDITKNYCAGKIINASIYSVLNGIVRCQLYEKEIAESKSSLNDELIIEGYAEIWDETQQSKIDHEQRKRVKREKEAVDDDDVLTVPTLSDVSKILYNQNEVFELPIDSFFESQSNRNFYSHEKIKIKGPFSPLECTFAGITKQTYSRHVHIERDSVNAVVLEPNYLTRHRRMLIAGSVGLTNNGEHVIIRDTTLMPNIRGFPSLMTLMFCPTAEYRINAKGDRYTGAVCGIGYDHVTGKSYDADNDVELTFDSEITRSDVHDINIIRFHLSDLMKQGFKSFGTAEIGFKQKRLRYLILELLQKYRRFEENAPKGFKWGKVPLNMYAEEDKKMVKDNRLFPIHNPLKINDFDFFTEIDKNLIQLNHLIESHKKNKNKKSESSMCLLCERKFHTAFDLSSHLISELHLEKVTAFTKEKSAHERQNKIKEEQMADEQQW